MKERAGPLRGSVYQLEPAGVHRGPGGFPVLFEPLASIDHVSDSVARDAIRRTARGVHVLVVSIFTLSDGEI